MSTTPQQNPCPILHLTFWPKPACHYQHSSLLFLSLLCSALLFSYLLLSSLLISSQSFSSLLGEKQGNISFFNSHFLIFWCWLLLAATGCWLAAGCCCWLLLAGCWLLLAAAGCCWLLLAGCWLAAAGCWLAAGSCCWLLAAAGCWLLLLLLLLGFRAKGF